MLVMLQILPRAQLVTYQTVVDSIAARICAHIPLDKQKDGKVSGRIGVDASGECKSVDPSIVLKFLDKTRGDIVRN